MQRKVAMLLVLVIIAVVAIPVAAETKTYTVRRGDTLYLIAQRFNISTQKLIDMNGISPPYEIYPGQVLIIGMSDDAPQSPMDSQGEKSGGFLGLNWGDLTQSYGWLALFAILKTFGLM
jgi:murein DD-endopeptidase MepM/ murein hydrolase activator NlpD